MIGTLRLGVSQRAPQRVGLEVNIGVREEQPVAGRNFTGTPHGMRLAHPTGWQFCDVDDSQLVPRFRTSRGPVHDRPGAIRGAVVDRDDFVVGILERQKLSQRLANMLFFVAGGDNDADPGLTTGSYRFAIPFRPCNVRNLRHSERGIDDPGEPDHRQNRA